MSAQIGVQMYTLRDHCKTPGDIAATCAKLSKMGFAAVQASALGPIEVTELRKILDDHGLACVATHKSLEELEDTEAVADYHAALGCELTAVGGFGGEGASRAQWQDFARRFNDVSRRLAPRGLKVGYHNHAHEFIPFTIDENPAAISPRDTPYHFLADTLDDVVWFELDTYWVQKGGASPAAWLDRLTGRVPAIHVKDMTVGRDKEPVMCEVGSGNLDWPGILAAADKAGVRWYLIERDRGALDPFESLKISLENLRAMGLS